MDFWKSRRSDLKFDEFEARVHLLFLAIKEESNFKLSFYGGRNFFKKSSNGFLKVQKIWSKIWWIWSSRPFVSRMVSENFKKVQLDDFLERVKDSLLWDSTSTVKLSRSPTDYYFLSFFSPSPPFHLSSSKKIVSHRVFSMFVCPVFFLKRREHGII